MTKRMLIPRSRIPKVIVICPRCHEGDVRTVMGAPFADGYFRRHKCQACDGAFYTLAPYDGSEAQVQATPFKDRELSDYEAAVRADWWIAEKELGDVTFEVTLLTRMQVALNKKDYLRTEVEKYLVGMYHALERKVREMETTDQKDTT